MITADIAIALGLSGNNSVAFGCELCVSVVRVPFQNGRVLIRKIYHRDSEIAQRIIDIFV